MQYLNEEQVRPFLSYEALIPAVERALIALSSGRIQQPVRSIVHVTERECIFALMPAVDGDLMGAKFVTIYERNAALGQPTHQAVIQLFSARTGEPLLAMDGRLITEMRTAAVSAAATRLLAPRNARVLALLGSGVQARAHLAALRLVREFREVRVWSRTAAHAQRFASENHVEIAETAERAVRGADVVVTVTNARAPVLRGEWLGGVTFVCAVGAVGPDRRELDDAAMEAAIVVESCEAAQRESAEIVSSGAAIYAELGELLAGRATLPLTGRAVFKSLGVAATDLAAAALVLAGKGTGPEV